MRVRMSNVLCTDSYGLHLLAGSHSPGLFAPLAEAMLNCIRLSPDMAFRGKQQDNVILDLWESVVDEQAVCLIMAVMH